MPWENVRPLDNFRLQLMRHMMAQASVTSVWPTIANHLRVALGPQATGRTVFELGSHLSAAFRSPGAEVQGRSQSNLSGGGAMWESLVTWYLNLVCFGTNLVAARKNQLWVPNVLRDAVSVNFGNKNTSTESDVFLFSVPQLPDDQAVNAAVLDAAIRPTRATECLFIIQCKTNWNDNAQIPMLWDLIYRSLTGRNLPNVFVGREGISLGDFERFGYAFATVPTNLRSLHRPSSLSVVRVSALSAGNYWGQPTLPDVAQSLSQLLPHNVGRYFPGGVDSHVTAQLAAHPDLADRFLALDFAVV